MELIYTQATFGIAWLGLEDIHTEDGVKALDTLLQPRRQLPGQQNRAVQRARRTTESAGVPLVSRAGWRSGLASIYPSLDGTTVHV